MCPMRFVHVGITDAAGVHLHQNLVRAGLRLRNIFHLPGAIHSGYDRSLHIVFLPGRFDADVSAIGTLDAGEKPRAFRQASPSRYRAASAGRRGGERGD